MYIMTFIALHYLLSSMLFNGCKGAWQVRETPNGKEEVNLTTCESCEVLVNSFHQGMKRTSRFSFGGGDTAWEEQNLGSYSESEIRLIEIQDGICQEDVKTKGVCLVLAELWEHHLENWWMRDRKSFPELRQYLCVVTVKACNQTDRPTECPTGYRMNKRMGCVDVNECLSNPCKRSHYCVNTEGSYACEFCDAACDGCFGAGPRMCAITKKTFKLNGDNLFSGRKTELFGLNLKYILMSLPVLLVIPLIFLVKLL